MRVLCALSICLVGCASTARLEEDVHARWDGSFVFVDVDVNQSAETLLLDTGSDVSLLSPELMTRLGIQTFERTFPIETSHGWTQTEPRQCANVLMQVGSLARRMDVITVPLNGISNALGKPVVGILGIDMWTDAMLQLDYPSQRIRLLRGHLRPPDGITVLPLTSRQARVELVLPGGDRVVAVIDSASRACLDLPRGVAERLRFAVPPRVTGYTTTLSGTAEKRTGRLDGTLEIGRYRIMNPLVAINNGNTAVIGSRLLEHFVVTLDVGRSRVEFARNGSDTIRIGPLRGLGAGLDQDAGGWVVSYVLPDGPAKAAGLQVGDRVVSLNGTRELSAERFATLIRTTDVLGLVIEREGSQRSVVVSGLTIIE